MCYVLNMLTVTVLKEINFANDYERNIFLLPIIQILYVGLHVWPSLA